MKSIIEEHLDSFYEEARYLQEHSDFCDKERQKVEKENTNLKQALNQIKEKLLSYGETFDSDIHRQFQKECLKIIEGVQKNV